MFDKLVFLSGVCGDTYSYTSNCENLEEENLHIHYGCGMDGTDLMTNIDELDVHGRLFCPSVLLCAFCEFPLAFGWLVLEIKYQTTYPMDFQLNQQGSNHM